MLLVVDVLEVWINFMFIYDCDGLFMFDRSKCAFLSLIYTSQFR